jgi:serine/threonine protein kinase
MNSRALPLPEGTEGTQERVSGNNIGAAKTEEHIARGKLTYGGFISLLQSLGVEHCSVRTPRYGMPIGQGRYFQVYRHTVSPADYQSMSLSIIGREPKPFSTDILNPGTHVAIKRMVVKDTFGKVDISGPGQLYATCQEITALLHPDLRDHDCIIKLQAIIWENGLGTGYEDREPLWPSLVMEYCETTLAEYQSRNVLTPLQRAVIGSKIGEGLDALHSARIFHGDLKSENVLLKIDKSGNVRPKLADFGCSVVFKDEEGTTKYYVAGTELWSAPEVRPCLIGQPTY